MGPFLKDHNSLQALPENVGGTYRNYFKILERVALLRSFQGPEWNLSWCSVAGQCNVMQCNAT